MALKAGSNGPPIILQRQKKDSNTMKQALNIIACWGALALALPVFAQEQPDSLAQARKRLIDTLTYETQSGLPMAASKIYFSDSKFTFSGFGEANYIHYDGPKDLASGDIELYMTNMYRFVSYAAWKPKPWLVVYGEIFAELLQDRNLEYHPEYFIEVFLDFLLHEKFNVRVGTHQVQIGYVNNNDEPVMFYSVNRPEVERLIIPSTWIDLGVMAYGKLNSDLKWSFSAYQGLDSRSFNGGTWIRRGRDEELRFNFNSVVLNSQWNYSGIKNTDISLSGVWTQAGGDKDFGERPVRANTMLLSSYIRHEHKNWTFMGLGSYGSMQETDQIFALTGSNTDNIPQVMGSQVYGYYAEVGYNLLPLLRARPSERRARNNFLVRGSEMKLPLFARYERLNTHAGIHPELADEPRFQKDLQALTVGLNFNPRRSIVLKANYQFRWNQVPLSTGEMEGDRFEMGVGFIF